MGGYHSFQNMIIPKLVDSKILGALASEDEKTMIVLSLRNYGGIGSFRYRGKKSRCYLFKYDKERACHILKVPESVANHDDGMILNDIFNQRPMPVPVIPKTEPFSSKDEGEVVRSPHSESAPVKQEDEEKEDTIDGEDKEDEMEIKPAPARLPANVSVDDLLGKAAVKKATKRMPNKSKKKKGK